MDKHLQKKLYDLVREDEKRFLEENINVENKIIRWDKQYELDRSRYLQKGKFVTIRQHTSFVEVPVHQHNYIEIVYMCAGSLTTVIDKKELVLREGDILIMNPYVRHSVNKGGTHDLAVNFITLPEFFFIPMDMLKGKNVIANFLIDAICQKEPVPHYLLFHLNHNPLIDNLMENLIGSLLENKPNTDQINQYTMGVVFLHLLNHLNDLEESSSQTYEDIIVQTVLRYIDNCYMTATLCEIATELHQSVSGLSKIIKRVAGYTFKELLQKKRFLQAVKFLVESDLPVNAISEVVGYENYSYFYKQFRKRYGMTPKEYRKKYKNEKYIRL